MRTTVIPLCILTIHTVYGQLNFEGNPLTEDTVYAAEESHFAEETNKARSLKTPVPPLDSYLMAAQILKASRSENLHSVENDEKTRTTDQIHIPSGKITSLDTLTVNDYKTPTLDVRKYPVALTNEVVVPATSEPHYSNTIVSSYNQKHLASLKSPHPPFPDPSKIALMTFLQSKTPQESQAALEQYLGSHKAPDASDNTPTSYQPRITDIVLPQEQSTNINQPPDAYLEYRSSRYGTLPASARSDQLPLPDNQRPSWNTNQARILVKSSPSVYASNKIYSVKPMHPHTVYRGPLRGPPSGLHKISQSPYGSDGGTPEIIYTKPPGYGIKYNGYKPGRKPYEDASSWFPESDHPPPDMNIYYSQLYAQSYDPHYYNYIAKYGKIKPHLYGKFEKHERSLVSELFQSFKSHGLKHVMNPMFLLGLGIPMITLMLSALVENRSLARSNSGTDSDQITDEEMDEWTRKLQKALEYYQKSACADGHKKCTMSN